jgi:hypothetical protein
MLALIWPTNGGHSVGIVRSRTQATEFSFFINDISKLLISCNKISPFSNIPIFKKSVTCFLVQDLQRENEANFQVLDQIIETQQRL